MKYSLKWLNDYCAVGLRPEALAEQLTGFGIEIETITRVGDDVIMDAEIVPVRADCLSMIGLAREISFLTGVPLTPPRVMLREISTGRGQPVDVDVTAPDLCPRYSARVVTGLRVGPAPVSLAARLEAVGVRALNNVVDITNFVNLETGQPLHAFDLAKIRGRRLIIRRAAPGERLVLLDGREIEFGGEELVIADAEGPVALAGIMGGAGSEVSAATETVVIESAYFDPRSVRKTARRFELATESSYRFERGTDPTATLDAADRAAALMAEVAGGVALSPALDVGQTSWPRPKIGLRPPRANLILGTALAAETMADLLRRLAFNVDIDRLENLVVIPPTYRRDVAAEVDVVEEIGRAYGYERLTPTLPRGRLPTPTRVRREEVEREARTFLTGAGFYEVYTPSFTDGAQLAAYGLDAARAVPVVNPVGSQFSHMRPALWPALAEVARRNGHRGVPGVSIFEIGTVFEFVDNGAIAERHRLALLAAGDVEPRFWQNRQPPQADFFLLKGVLTTLARTWGYSVEWRGASFSVNGAAGSYFTCAVGPWAPAHIAEFDIRPLYTGEEPPPRRYEPISRFPSIGRDMALVVPHETPAGEVVAAIHTSSPLVREVTVFDVYQGAGLTSDTKSIGIRVRYQADDRTLTDDEANAAREEAVKILAARFGATLRRN